MDEDHHTFKSRRETSLSYRYRCPRAQATAVSGSVHVSNLKIVDIPLLSIAVVLRQ